jgi:hypothetical protein
VLLRYNHMEKLVEVVEELQVVLVEVEVHI